MAQQQRGRRLSIGAGNRNQWTRVEPKGELWLADPASTALAERSEHWSVRGDSWTDHQDPGACQPVDVVSSQLDRGSGGLEIGSTS